MAVPVGGLPTRSVAAAWPSFFCTKKLNVGRVPEVVLALILTMAACHAWIALMSGPFPLVVSVCEASSTISRLVDWLIYFFTAKVFCPVLFQLVFAERDLAEPLKILPLPCDRRVFSASKLPPLLPVGLPPEITIAPAIPPGLPKDFVGAGIRSPSPCQPSWDSR